MKCKDCGTIFKGKLCPCGWSPTRSAPKTMNCRTCNVIHQTAYLILGQCHDCFAVASLEPTALEYYRTMSDKYGLKLFDIPMHIRAANVKNVRAEDYLKSLPRSREQFDEMFAGTKWQGMI